MRNPLKRVKLHPDERVLTVTRASLVLPGITYTLTLSILIGIYVLMEHSAFLYASLGLLAIVIAHAIHRHQFLWVITTHRTIAQRGILNIHTATVSHDRITDTSTTLPFLSGIFGTGSVRISTAGNDDIQITIFAQHAVQTINHLLHDLKRAARTTQTALTKKV